MPQRKVVQKHGITKRTTQPRNTRRPLTVSARNIVPIGTTTAQKAVTDEFKIGDKVLYTTDEIGVIRYIGPTRFKDSIIQVFIIKLEYSNIDTSLIRTQKGVWIGIEFKKSIGKNDGSIQGTRYFNCRPNHGLFTARREQITKLPSSAVKKIEGKI